MVSMANLVAATGDEVEYRIVCSDRDYLETTPYSHIEPNAWNKVGNAWVWYLPRGRSKYVHIHRIVERTPCHKVYINGLYSKVFSVFPLIAAKRLGKPVVLAPRGMLAPGALSVKGWKKKVFLGVFRRLRLFDGVIFQATHTAEAAQVKKELGIADLVHVVPNLPRTPSVVCSASPRDPGPLKLLMVARIAPEKNVHYALEVLERVHTGRPIAFTVAGPVYSQGYYSACQERAQRLSPNGIRVHFTGPLEAEAIDRLLEQTHLFFLPSRGENFGHAIAESLLAGLPVLISDCTPWRNLAQKGWGADLPLANPEAFAKYITQMAEGGHTLGLKNNADLCVEAREHLRNDGAVQKYIALFS